MAKVRNLTRCESCKGEYPDLQPDGTLYFHQCPESKVVPILGVQPIANRRDENLIFSDRLVEVSNNVFKPTVQIKAPGAGTTVLGPL